MLRDNGFLVYDIDKWVKYLYYKKEFLYVIKNYFPEVFENGIFDKRKLRNIVFNDSQKLKILEKLIHPFLKNKLRTIIRKNKDEGLVFVDVALLFEMKWEKYFDFIILADVDKKIQKQRVMKRDNISASDFDKINDIQMSMDDKREKVDFIVNTGVSLRKLNKSVLETVEYLKNYE